MKRFNILIICFLAYATVCAQFQTNVDSLKLLIAESPDDTMKVKKINKIIIELLSVGNFNEAEVFINKAEKLSDKLYFKKGQGNVLNFRGIICDDKGMVTQALDYYFKALKIFEEINHYGGITDISNNIGLIYLNQNQLDQALSYFFKAKKYAELSKKRFILDNPINNIGSVYFKKKDYVNALKYYNESYELRKELEFHEGCIQSLTNLGNVYAAMGDTSEAITKYLTALEMAQKMDEPRSIAIVEASLGPVYLTVDKSKGVAYLKDGLSLANKINLMDIKRSINKTLSDYYTKNNELNTAFVYYKDYIAAKDSLFNQENIKKTTSAELNYMFDKKESLVKIEQEKKDAIAGEEKQKQRIILYSVITILLMVALLAIIIFRGYKQKKNDNLIITQQKKVVEHQKHLVDEQQKELLDSIHYAKRIQDALLANKEFVNAHLSENFILFKPKDIVSGDFYWATEHNNKFYLAICDCTGHGVPGAFMSLLNMGFLNEAIKEKGIVEPNEVFNYVRKRLINSVSTDGQKDGMDGIFICLDKATKKLSYSAANNEPVLITKTSSRNELTELSKDRMPVGIGELTHEFINYTINYQEGDVLYLYTDGYADQFGGAKGKKFKYKQLNEMLLKICNESMASQEMVLDRAFNEWKGQLEQVDDVLLVGIRL